MLDEFETPREELAARVPLGRTADVSEVARLVRFLESEDASHCSGHEFVIDRVMKT